MLRYNIAQLKASAAGRPEGFVKFALHRGKIEGDFVFLNDADQAELARTLLPAKFPIRQLQREAAQLPPGFADFIQARGKANGLFMELNLETLDELHEKFPVPVFGLPQEPTLAEMTANFTQAVSGWAKAGFKVVERETFEERHAVCKTCEFWLPDARLGIGKCRKCGCSIYKLWMATSQCPLTPPRW